MLALGKHWRDVAPMQTAETFLTMFWVAFPPLVVLFLAIGANWIGDQIARSEPG